MKCFNCGAIMIEGQKICSICDTDNSSYIYENNYPYNYEPIKHERKINNKKTIIESEQVNKKTVFGSDQINKKNNYIFYFFVIILVFIIICLLLKYILKLNVNKKINSNDEIFKVYERIENDINVKKLLGEQIYCINDCYEYYDYDDSRYSLSINEYEDYYEILIKDNIYNIDTSLCNNIKCNDSTIINKIYK